MVSKEELAAEKQRAIDSWAPAKDKGGRGGKLKPTYDKSNIFGASSHHEGRGASKASKRDKGRW